jgi:hypothetical protein
MFNLYRTQHTFRTTRQQFSQQNNPIKDPGNQPTEPRPKEHEIKQPIRFQPRKQPCNDIVNITTSRQQKMRSLNHEHTYHLQNITTIPGTIYWTITTANKPTIHLTETEAYNTPQLWKWYRSFTNKLLKTLHVNLTLIKKKRYWTEQKCV